jgi:hypothetical protein
MSLYLESFFNPVQRERFSASLVLFELQVLQMKLQFHGNDAHKRVEGEAMKLHMMYSWDKNANLQVSAIYEEEKHR